MTRGQVFFATINNKDNTHIQQGNRPWVVVQNDAGNKFGPTLIIIPLTRNLNKRPDLPTHCFVHPRGLFRSIALCEQITVIDKQPYFKVVSKLSSYDMRKIDMCLKCALGLEVP